MRTRSSAETSIVVALASILCCCGGGSNANLGGNPSPPLVTTEILYAANTVNAVFAFKVDQTSGALTECASVSPGGLSASNSALALTPAGTFAYAVNDVVSGINGYSTSSSGTLSLIGGSPFPILPSVQPSWAVVPDLTIDPTGNFLFAATLGGIATFAIDSTTGALSATGGPFSVGPGIVPPGIAVAPNGRFLYATDQNQSVWAFTIDPNSGTLTPVSGSPYFAGSQPYGLKVDPSGKFLYVALSNAAGIAAFSVDSASGALTAIPGSPYMTAASQFTQTYRLTIDPSGKFLYAFNLNGRTVSAFTIDPISGALSAISGSPFPTNSLVEGDLAVDPAGKFLYLTIGSGPPSEFFIFDIDPLTGALTSNPQSPVVGADGPDRLSIIRFQ